MKTISKTIYTYYNNDYTEGENVAKNQIKMAKEIIDKTGYNIVTCGECGNINIINTFDEEHECMHCNYKSESCDFPDLIFDGMTIVKKIE